MRTMPVELYDALRAAGASDPGAADSAPSLGAADATVTPARIGIIKR